MIGPLAQRGDRVCENLAPLSIVLGWNLPDPGQHQIRPQLVGEGKRPGRRGGSDRRAGRSCQSSAGWED